MTKTVKIIAAVCIIVFAAVLSNPSAERHRHQITESFSERSPLADLLGLGAVTAFVSNYHSIGVASYTSVHGNVVSIGLFGMVFVLDAQKDPI